MAGRHKKRLGTWFHIKRGWALLLPLAIVASMMLGTAGYSPSDQATDQSATSSDASTPTDAPSTDPSTAPPATSDPSAVADPSPSATDAPADSPSQEPSPADTSSATDAPSDVPSSTDAPSPSDTSSPTNSDKAPSATRTLLVRLVSGLSDADVTDAIVAGGGTTVSSVDALRLYVVDVPAASVDASVAEYSSDVRVQSVDRDRTRDAEATPNDPAYGSQWALPQIGWDQVYGTTTPSGIATIAVLDTGVQSNDVPTGPGWSAFGTDPTVDPNGHGTWVASIAAATPDNGEGIAGVGFAGVDVMPVQVLSADGTGQDSDIIAGLVWAADHGANVAVMAFSNPGYSSALQDAVNYAWNHGVVVVAAAGNDGATTPNFPAGDAKVVGVGATDQNDQLWSGSNQSNAVFLTAPGVDIKADSVGGGTDSVTGTSMSAAIVAGAAAQLLAIDPNATPGAIVGGLARSTDPNAGTANGRVNLGRSLTETSSDSVVPEGAPGGGPIVGPYVAAATNRTITYTKAGAGTGTVTFTLIGSGDSPDSQSGGGTTSGAVATCSGSGSFKVKQTDSYRIAASSNGGSSFAG